MFGLVGVGLGGRGRRRASRRRPSGEVSRRSERRARWRRSTAGRRGRSRRRCTARPGRPAPCWRRSTRRCRSSSTRCPASAVAVGDRLADGRGRRRATAVVHRRRRSTSSWPSLGQHAPRRAGTSGGSSSEPKATRVRPHHGTRYVGGRGHAPPAPSPSCPTPTGTGSGTCRSRRSGSGSSSCSTTCCPQLEADPCYAHFLLDGQLAVVDDYLAVRPEATPTAPAPGRQPGRIAVGPVVHAARRVPRVGRDARSATSSSASRRAAPLGGAMEVGYLPDMFGHVAQMPQLLRLFGIERRRRVARRARRGRPHRVPVGRRPTAARCGPSTCPTGYGNGARVPARRRRPRRRRSTSSPTATARCSTAARCSG